MEIHKLQQMLSEMSLQEKIGQMVQLTGVYFDKEAVLTGVVGEQLPPEWVIQYAGSVLGVIGKEKICDIQSKYMEQHPHHIPLLFMADVIHMDFMVGSDDLHIAGIREDGSETDIFVDGTWAE